MRSPRANACASAVSSRNSGSARRSGSGSTTSPRASSILGPHELQRHARLAHLLAHPCQVDRRALGRLVAADGAELRSDRARISLRSGSVWDEPP